MILPPVNRLLSSLITLLPCIKHYYPKPSPLGLPLLNLYHCYNKGGVAHLAYFRIYRQFVFPDLVDLDFSPSLIFPLGFCTVQPGGTTSFPFLGALPCRLTPPGCGFDVFLPLLAVILLFQFTRPVPRSLGHRGDPLLSLFSNPTPLHRQPRRDLF